MIRKITQKIQKLETSKEQKINKQLEIQAEINEIDTNLKKLYSFKKDYEKLQNNSTEFLKNI